jgi:hypothetical protein
MFQSYYKIIDTALDLPWVQRLWRCFEKSRSVHCGEWTCLDKPRVRFWWPTCTIVPHPHVGPCRLGVNNVNLQTPRCDEFVAHVHYNVWQSQQREVASLKFAKEKQPKRSSHLALSTSMPEPKVKLFFIVAWALCHLGLMMSTVASG